ncbi:hypothetical protein TgHK011_006948 [Trichoderma gracile]|nr:hypothetical protein TgHK011_006948 [Trichoderma gracile]
MDIRHVANQSQLDIGEGVRQVPDEETSLANVSHPTGYVGLALTLIVAGIFQHYPTNWPSPSLALVSGQQGRDTEFRACALAGASVGLQNPVKVVHRRDRFSFVRLKP